MHEGEDLSHHAPEQRPLKNRLGMALGPHDQTLAGCACGQPALDVRELKGKVIRREQDGVPGSSFEAGSLGTPEPL